MKSQKNKMIGIVGGMGPYAGLDLARKIFDLTQAKGSGPRSSDINIKP